MAAGNQGSGGGLGNIRSSACPAGGGAGLGVLGGWGFWGMGSALKGGKAGISLGRVALALGGYAAGQQNPGDPHQWWAGYSRVWEGESRAMR